MPIVGPSDNILRPEMLYFFDQTLAPNQWVPWSTTSGPTIQANNYIWDAGTSTWVRMQGSTDGRAFVDLHRINTTPVTADDWTQRFRGLNDGTAPGLAQAIGLTAPAPINAVANLTERRFLELILASLGGTVNESHETLAVTTPAGGGTSAAQVYASNVDVFDVTCETDDAEIQTQKTDGVTWNAGWILVKKNSFKTIALAGRAWRARNRGGVVLVAPPTLTVTGYRN